MTDTHAAISLASTRDLYDGIREVLSSAHEGSGTSDGQPLDGCPGCWAQAALEEIATRHLCEGDSCNPPAVRS